MTYHKLINFNFIQNIPKYWAQIFVKINEEKTSRDEQVRKYVKSRRYFLEIYTENFYNQTQQEYYETRLQVV